MPTLKEIGARITAVTAIKMTTEAMKMIAQAKVTKAEQRLKEVRAFSENIENVFKAVAAPPSTEENSALKTQVLGMGTDQGLCGSINSGLARHTANLFEADYTENDDVELFAFGNRYISSVGARLPVAAGISGYQKSLTFRETLFLCDELLTTVPDERRILFNRMVSMAAYVVDEIKLPNREALDQIEEGVYELEGVNEVLEDFYDFHFAVAMWRVLAEVETSELSSRSMAMTNSTTAATEMEAELKLIYSKLRQDMITTEIIEISVGATQTLKNKEQ